MKFSILGAIVLVTGISAAPTATTTGSATSTTSYIPQHSPSFANVPAATGVVSEYNYGPYNLSASLPTYALKGYPDAWSIPPTDSDEVKAAIKAIDWSLVPDAGVRHQDKNGNFKPDTDGDKDPYCWWSDTNCVHPKINIAPDYYSCDKNGDWGLSYDDGPFNLYTGKDAKTENPYAEPQLYNYLAEHNNQKATLFYIGSNVMTYPEAAKRALNDGHYICVHTWSHPAMTTVTNEQAVAEFYWTLKAIKEATGVTPKCWRPPQGDVDDRIRSIAWQMGMRTVLWNRDTNDWDMPAPGGGNLSPNTVDGYFKTWLKDQEDGKNKEGILVLEHELNHATVNMTEKWLPTIQKTFNVIPALACNDVSQPYWEENWVYPTSNIPANTSSTSNAAHVNSSSTTANIVL